MNYMDCLKKWDKSLKESGLKFEYRVVKGHNRLRPKDGLLSLHDLLHNECRIEIDEFENRLGVNFAVDFATRLLSKTGVRIETIEFYRTSGKMAHYYFY